MTYRSLDFSETNPLGADNCYSVGSGASNSSETLNNKLDGVGSQDETYFIQEIKEKNEKAHSSNPFVKIALGYATHTNIWNDALSVSIGTVSPSVSAGGFTGSINFKHVLVVLDHESYAYYLNDCNVSSASTLELHNDIELDNQIRELVGKKRINEARNLLMLAKPCGTGLSPKLAKWARLLAPPVMKNTGKGTAIDAKKAMNKLKENKEQYSNEWVALKGDEIIDHDKSKANLYKKLKNNNMASGSLFIYVG